MAPGKAGNEVGNPRHHKKKTLERLRDLLLRNPDIPKRNKKDKQAFKFRDASFENSDHPQSHSPARHNSEELLHRKKFNPVGFFIIPTDSEPKLEDAEKKIGWLYYLYKITWPSLIFIEMWMSHVFLPLNFAVGVAFFLFSRNEGADETMRALVPLSGSLPGIVIALSMLTSAFFIFMATMRRSGGLTVVVLASSLFGLLIQCYLVLIMGIAAKDTKIKAYISDTMDLYGRPGQYLNSKEIDEIQRKFRCCGVKGPKDWLKQDAVNPDNSTKNKLPPSCCQFPHMQTWRLHTECIYTENKKSMEYTKFHLKGCTQSIHEFINEYYNVRYPLDMAATSVLIGTIICSIIYMSRVYTRLAAHVKPHIRPMVAEIVDKAEDEIFGGGNELDDGGFDPDVRRYIKFNLARCQTIDEVQEFLEATADVQTYMRHLSPGDLARDILTGKPELLHRFESVLERHIGKPDSEHQHDSAMAAIHHDDEHYGRIYDAQKNWMFIKKKMDSYHNFLQRAELFNSLHGIVTQVKEKEVQDAIKAEEDDLNI